ncbi:MAG: hypothetical protein ACM36C_04290 [Acidobacteriota bacterium]
MKYLGSAVTGLAFALTFGASAPAARIQDAPKPKKPSVSVKANPSVSFSPARVVFVADLKGGADDFEEFYCADVEWEWGDGTESENSTDCEPYEPGKSKIQRHFSTEHRYETQGEYRVVFRLKRQDKIVGSGTTIVRVRPGLRDIG